MSLVELFGDSGEGRDSEYSGKRVDRGRGQHTDRAQHGHGVTGHCAPLVGRVARVEEEHG